jgi:hypothetical protein
MPFWEVLVSIIWFMLLVAWFWLLIVIIGDLFRDRSLSGFAKAMWCIFLIVLPWIGVLCYLLVRGHTMGERANQEAAENEKAFRAYVREAAGSSGTVADELAKLSDMRDRGVISPADYEAAKARVLGQPPHRAAS